MGQMENHFFFTIAMTKKWIGNRARTVRRKNQTPHPVKILEIVVRIFKKWQKWPLDGHFFRKSDIDFLRS